VEDDQVAKINIAKIKAKLEEERKRVQEELDQLNASVRSDERREGSPFGKREEEATESMEFEKRLALERRLYNSLEDLDKALKKIEEGTYGICENCGQPIDPARLEVLPQAVLCLNCRQKLKNGKT
jgi:DnaK suppressor protein